MRVFSVSDQKIMTTRGRSAIMAGLRAIFRVTFTKSDVANPKMVQRGAEKMGMDNLACASSVIQFHRGGPEVIRGVTWLTEGIGAGIYKDRSCKERSSHSKQGKSDVVCH